MFRRNLLSDWVIWPPLTYLAKYSNDDSYFSINMIGFSFDINYYQLLQHLILKSLYALYQ